MFNNTITSDFQQPKEKINLSIMMHNQSIDENMKEISDNSVSLKNIMEEESIDFNQDNNQQLQSQQKENINNMSFNYLESY